MTRGFVGVGKSKSTLRKSCTCIHLFSKLSVMEIQETNDESVVTL